MNLKDLELAQELRRELEAAESILLALEREPEATVPVYARTKAWTGRPSVTVELLPVDKSVAVRAAQGHRSMIVAQLQALGVTVDGGTPP